MEGLDTHMTLEGKMVQILTRIDPKLYKKYTVTENGRSVTYGKLRKALYYCSGKMLRKNLSHGDSKLTPMTGVSPIKGKW